MCNNQTFKHVGAERGRFTRLDRAARGKLGLGPSHQEACDIPGVLGLGGGLLYLLIICVLSGELGGW